MYTIVSINKSGGQDEKTFATLSSVQRLARNMLFWRKALPLKICDDKGRIVRSWQYKMIGNLPRRVLKVTRYQY